MILISSIRNRKKTLARCPHITRLPTKIWSNLLLPQALAYTACNFIHSFSAAHAPLAVSSPCPWHIPRHSLSEWQLPLARTTPWQRAQPPMRL